MTSNRIRLAVGLALLAGYFTRIGHEVIPLVHEIGPILLTLAWTLLVVFADRPEPHDPHGKDEP